MFSMWKNDQNKGTEVRLFRCVLITLASLKVAQDVCKCTTSKRIELESPGWSGLVRF